MLKVSIKVTIFFIFILHFFYNNVKEDSIFLEKFSEIFISTIILYNINRGNVPKLLDIFTGKEYYNNIKIVECYNVNRG